MAGCSRAIAEVPNYTTFLNLAFLLLMAALGWRFLRTGGRQMLQMMNIAPAT